MADYFAAYCQLLTSKPQLGYCRGAHSLEELLARIKTLWHCTALDDDQLLSAIAHCNSMYLPAEVNLTGNWLPYCYKPAVSAIKWMLPDGAPKEPFHEEYISRCRQQLMNQIIQPCCHIDNLQKMTATTYVVEPAGFIFHLSRCGSTLVSGCLAEFERARVFSEAPLLTELLLDKQLVDEEKILALRAIITLQAAVYSTQSQLIIKWNAWDIFNWALIRRAFPLTPVILLFRNPLEILASHQNLAGRHMSGDPSLKSLHDVFSVKGTTVLSWRSAILGGLMDAMGVAAQASGVLCMDYSRVDKTTLMFIGGFLKLHEGKDVQQKIAERMLFHAKQPAMQFVNDVQDKRALFSSEEILFVKLYLGLRYSQLLLEDKACFEYGN